MDEYKSKLEALGIATKAPALDPSWTEVYADNGEKSVKVRAEDVPLEERDNAGCSDTRTVVEDGVQTFVDWDVQMSPIVCASNGDSQITITSGYTVANLLGGSGGFDLGIIKDWLGVKYNVDYSRTYTSSTLIAHQNVIYKGNCGVVITKPVTTRRHGRLMRGCPGSFQQIGTWYADSHREETYGGVKWVEGFIDTCQRRQPAGVRLARCSGGGYFV